MRKMAGILMTQRESRITILKNFEMLWADQIVNNRLTIILVTVLILISSVIAIHKFPLRYDNSFEMFMLEGDPNIERFKTFRDLFGDAEYLVIGIEARQSDRDLFAEDTIKLIHEISEMLEDHEHTTKVSSLSNYQYTHSSNGALITEDLFYDPDSFLQGTTLDSAREIMRGEKIALKNLITEDFQNTRIIARTEYIENENHHKIRISNDIYDFLREKDYAKKGYKIRLGGSAIIAERFENLSKRDTSLLNPLVAIIMFIILYFLFGSVIISCLPWLLVGTSVLILSGIQAILGFPMTVVNSALVPTLMIIAMGVSIHILTEFFFLRQSGKNPFESAKQTVKTLFKPLFFTGFTTSIGFAALSITQLLPVKHYALLAAVGSLIVFVISVTFFVSALSYISIYPTKSQNLLLNRFVSSLTGKIAAFCSFFSYYIVLSASLLIIFCIISVPRISVDSNIFNYFKSSNWVKQDMKYFDNLYKTGGIELVIDSGRAEGIKDPIFLKRVEALETYLDSLDQTGKVISAVNFLKRLRQTLYAGDPNFYALPESSEMTAQLLLMYSSSGSRQDLSDSIDFENRFLRVSVPVVNMSAKHFSNFYNEIQEEVANEHPNLSVTFTGPLVLYNVQETYINSGLKRSFSVALLMIGLTFFIVFKSFKYGFIALFPSILPILTAGGMTILVGLSLDLGTIIVGAMCIGIAVDDAIHVMSRYLRFKGDGLSTFQSIDGAMRSSGKAVIFTSLILVAGFSTMVFASLIPTILFGVCVALIMSLALLGDTLILPALLLLLEKD